MIKETWLSRPPRKGAWGTSLLFLAVIILASTLYLCELFGAERWMPASGEAVFQRHEWWRLWSTLFAHGDLEHLASNALLFLPFSYFLSGYFGALFFPLTGILLLGLANAFVLTTLPPESTLIGISGLVYWMGAVWLTLYLLVERHDRPKRRWGNFIFLGMMLFIPETLRPEISYLSHFLGFILGAASGLAYYFWNREAIHAAEKTEIILELESIPEEEWMDKPTDS